MTEDAKAEVRQIYETLADDYDQLVPHLRGLVLSYDAIVDILPLGRGEPVSVMDVGIGPGHLAEKILERYPDVRLTGLDPSRRMLDRAAERLDAFKDRLDLIEGDITAGLPNGPYDAIVSSNALIYKHMDLVQCYRRIRSALVPSGVFLNSSLVAPESSELEPLLSQWMSRLQQQELDGDLVKRLQSKGRRVSTFDQDSLTVAHGIEAHLEFLRKAGFDTFACLWRCGHQAVLCGMGREP